MKTFPLRSLVHRILLIRLGIATVLIAAAIATITYFTQEARLRHQVGLCPHGNESRNNRSTTYYAQPFTRRS